MKTKIGGWILMIIACFVCSAVGFFIFDYFRLDLFWHIGGQVVLYLIMILSFLFLNRNRKINKVVFEIQSISQDIIPSDYRKIDSARSKYDALSPRLREKVYNYEVLVKAEGVRAEQQEIKAVIVEIKNIPQNITPHDYKRIESARSKYDALSPRLRGKIYNYDDLTKAEEAWRLVSRIEVLEKQDYSLVETSMQDFYTRRVSHDVWKRVGNKSSLEAIEKSIQQKKDFPYIQEKAGPFRNMCTAIELQNIDKLTDEHEKIMRQMSVYCEKSNKTSIEKYGENFLDCSNYFNNYCLDWMPKNRYSLRFCCIVGNYYYNKIHNNKAAYRWFAVAKEIFEYQGWDFSEYATEASNMYKVIADMTASDSNEKFLYYLASFLCDTGNKEVYQYLKKYDSDNKDMYTQYMNKIHPLNWERIEMIWDKSLDRICKTADAVNNVGNSMQSIKSGLPDLNAVSQFRKDCLEIKNSRQTIKQEHKKYYSDMHNLS